MSNNCRQLPRHCRPRRVVGVFERRKSRSFCKSLSSQLRSYRLRRCCIAPIFSPFFDRLIVPTSRIFSFFLVLFSIVRLILPCQISSVCMRIGYELFMVSERANYGRKSDFIYYRSPDAIYNRRELVARAVTFFSVIYANFGADPPLRESQEVISMRSHPSG